MKAPLPLTLILTDQTVESTGWVLQWTAQELPIMWEGKVASHGAIEVPRSFARVIAETLFGVVWEAHKPAQLGRLSAGLDLLSTRAVPSGRSQ